MKLSDLFSRAGLTPPPATATATDKGMQIADIAIGHLAPVFGNFKGKSWGPVNPDAVVLSVKGAPKGDYEVKGSKAFIDDFAARLKEKYPSVKAVYGPVSSSNDVETGLTSDDADYYNSVFSLVANLYWDLQAAYGIFDDESRSIACVVAIDNFIDALNTIVSIGAEEKAQLIAIPAVKAAMDSAPLFKAFMDAIGSPRLVKPGDTPATPGQPVETVRSEVEAIKASLQASLQADFEVKLKAGIEAAVAPIKTDLATATQKATDAEAALTAIVGKAREPLAPGFATTLNSDGSHHDPATGETHTPGSEAASKAQAQINATKTGGEGGLTSIGAAVKAARLAAGRS